MANPATHNTGFEDVVQADIRIAILRFLESGGYSQNESILHDLLKRTGRIVGRDRVRTELSWLREQGLLVIDEVYDTWVADITQRGLDVATGAATVPGVARPRPKG